MPLIWRPQMSIGNAAMDDDHRYLICLANTIEIALRGDPMNDVLQIAVEELSLHAQRHFVREENLMIALRYTRCDEHRRAHHALMTRFEEVRNEFAQVGDNAGAKEGALAKLTLLHRSWLADHLLGEDMLLKPLFEQHPYDYTG
jgi:hemerythrin